MNELNGYSDKLSVRPGETLRFMVSSDRAYTAAIVRLICGDTNPEGPGFKEEIVETSLGGPHDGRRQDIHIGSLVVVPWPAALPASASLTLTCMIWPTTPLKGTPQTLLARWSTNEQSGFALQIGAAGDVTFTLGSGDTIERVSTGTPLHSRQWYWVGATYDHARRRATVFQQALHAGPGDQNECTAEAGVDVEIGPTSAPLTMAAHIEHVDGHRLVTTGHYNGKLDSPRLAGAALDANTLHNLQHAPTSADTTTVMAAWDFAQGTPTTRVTDIGPYRLDGETVNLPARGVTGWNWDGAEIGWPHAPAAYGAMHFHDDDLYDAAWEPDFDYAVPPGTRSGLYAARLSGGALEEYIPYYVRAPRGGPTAAIAFLAPTATYMAYGNCRLGLHSDDGEVMLGRLLRLQPHDLFLADNPQYGASLYDLHSDGSGVCYASRLRPDLLMRPKRQRWDSMGSSWLRHFNADTHVLDWLEAKHHRYDVLTDEDLHREGLSSLARYDVVITGTHPEYYTTQMWEALAGFTDRGGRLIYMGGNGFYWRTAYHRELPGVIEVRRAAGTRTWDAAPGELTLSFTGEPGGLLRHVGRPPQRLVGVGFVSMGFDRSGHYRRRPDSFDPRAAFIFDGIGDDERIGDFGLIGGGTAGIEIDRAEPALGTPPHALVVASSEGHSDMFRATPEELTYNAYAASGTTSELVRSDMVFFETANGGAVFAVGSIAWCGALSHSAYDNNVSRITDNVVRRFADSTPF